MSGIKLTWDIGSFNPEKHYIYRSASPISPSNLPTPIAEVGQGINEYNDLSITDGETYHYFVAAEKMGLLCPADSSVRVLTSFGPGPQTLMAGDMTDGFFGEVDSSLLITGDDLATQSGITQGTSQNSTTPWLKFALDGGIIYVPKKPIRNTISWEHIYQAGAVYGTDTFGSNPSGGGRLQDARITIDGYEFKVTLLKGANSDPADGNTGFDTPMTHGSEWNRLMYSIHSGVDMDERNPSNPSTPYNQWASYSDSDLIVYYTEGPGPFSWTQETYGSNGRLGRGEVGVTLVGSKNPTDNSTARLGWRPVLRLQL